MYSVLQSACVCVGKSELSTYFKNRKSITNNLRWTAVGLPLISVA